MWADAGGKAWEGSRFEIAERVVLFWVLTAADVLLSMAELLCEPHRKLLSF